MTGTKFAFGILGFWFDLWPWDVAWGFQVLYMYC